jgi:Zn-dependent protease with chaperone function
MDRAASGDTGVVAGAQAPERIEIFEERSSLPDRSGAPPWLYPWAVLFLLGLPEVFQLTTSAWEQLQQQIAQDRELIGTALEFRVAFLMYPFNFVEVIPALALLLGLVTVLFPRLRAAYLEKRFRLAPLAEGRLPAFDQIRTYLGEHAPQLEVRGNPLRMNQLAFVYPARYRQARIAVFGGLVGLWHRDREAAQAVLLHEVVHARRGDVLIVGAGSLLERMLRMTILFHGVVFLLPLLLMTIVQRVDFHISSVALGMPAGMIWAQHGRQVANIFLQGYGLVSLGVLFFLFAVWAPAIGAIWSVELNADRLVVAKQRSAAGISRALGSMAGKTGWWRWLLFRLSHPPLRLRQWMVRQPGRLGLALLLSVFPLAYLARLLALHAWASTHHFIMGTSTTESLESALQNTLYFLGAITPTAAAVTVLLLLWPFAWTYWERLMGWTRRPQRSGETPVYLTLALAMGMLAALGLLLR